MSKRIIKYLVSIGLLRFLIMLDAMMVVRLFLTDSVYRSYGVLYSVIFITLLIIFSVIDGYDSFKLKEKQLKRMLLKLGIPMVLGVILITLL